MTDECTIYVSFCYVISFSDKLPEWIVKFKQEGLTDQEIGEIIKGKTEKYIGKWGNTSKVSILINSYDSARIASEQLVMNPRTQAVRNKAGQHPETSRNSSLPAI